MTKEKNFSQLVFFSIYGIILGKISEEAVSQRYFKFISILKIHFFNTSALTFYLTFSF